MAVTTDDTHGTALDNRPNSSYTRPVGPIRTGYSNRLVDIRRMEA